MVLRILVQIRGMDGQQFLFAVVSEHFYESWIRFDEPSLRFRCHPIDTDIDVLCERPVLCFALPQRALHPFPFREL